MTTETKAILRGVRLSEQKGRLVADLVRGKTVEQALNILSFTRKRARRLSRRLLSLRSPMPSITMARISMRCA